jgi:hypothetical protein
MTTYPIIPYALVIEDDNYTPYHVELHVLNNHS